MSGTSKRVVSAEKAEASLRYKARWRALHGDVELTPVVDRWLSISFRIARTLNALHLTPNALSLLGGLFAIATFISAHSWFALLFLTLSLLADGVDGSLAIFQSRESLRGALIDSTVDRISEFFWLLALLSIGGNLSIALAIYVFALTQEYVRARLLGVGDYETGVVTIGERPHRVIYFAFALIAYQLRLVFDWQSNSALIAVLFAWAVIQFISLMMVLRNAYTQITIKDRLSN